MNTPDTKARDIEALAYILTPSPAPRPGSVARPLARRLAWLASPPVAAGILVGVAVVASLLRYFVRS